MADSFTHRFTPKFELFNGYEASKSHSTRAKNSNRQRELKINNLQSYINRPSDTFSLFHNSVLSSLKFQKKQKDLESNAKVNNILNSNSNVNFILSKRIKLAALDKKNHKEGTMHSLNHISLHINSNFSPKKKDKESHKSFALNNDSHFKKIKRMSGFADFLNSSDSKTSLIKHLTATKLTDTSRNCNRKILLSIQKKLPILYINSSRRIRLNYSNRPMKKIYSHLDIKRVLLENVI